MAFYVENKGGNFERCPPGLHLARCYQIIDLGTQRNEFKGQVKFLPQVRIGWEIHGTNDNGVPIKMSDGRPFAVFKTYTHSWSDKATLRLHLQSWRGKPFTQEEMRRFDLENILGAWCMLNLIETSNATGDKFTNIDKVVPVPPVIKQSGLPEGVNKTMVFYLQEPDMTVFDSLSEKLKGLIMASPEWEKMNKKSNPINEANAQAQVAAAEDIDDDSIPF